jgi:hypothetical protein
MQNFGAVSQDASPNAAAAAMVKYSFFILLMLSGFTVLFCDYLVCKSTNKKGDMG